MPCNFKRGSEMPKRPDVGAIAEQVIQRLEQIEDQVTHNQRIELPRVRWRLWLLSLKNFYIPGFVLRW